MNNVVLTASFVPATIAVGAFTAMLPETAVIRRATDADTMTKGDVRTAEKAATAITVLIGAATSFVVKSPYPLYSALVSCVALIALYEAILSVNPHPNQKVMR